MNSGECIIEFQNVELRPNSQAKKPRPFHFYSGDGPPVTKLHRGEVLLLEKTEVPFLVEMAGGLEKADSNKFFASGEVLFCGHTWDEIEKQGNDRAKRGQIGFVLSHERNTAVWISHWTFRENLMLGSLSVGRTGARERMEELAKKFGLKRKIKIKTKRYEEERDLLDLRPSDMHDEEILEAMQGAQVMMSPSPGQILTALQWVRAMMNAKPDLLVFEDAVEPFLARDESGHVTPRPRLADEGRPNENFFREILNSYEEDLPAIICRTKSADLWRRIFKESRYRQIFQSAYQDN